MSWERSLKKARGYTLLELLIVIAIIGVLITIGVFVWNSVLEREHDNTRKLNLSQIGNALNQYDADQRQYPKFQNSLTISCSSSGVINYTAKGQLNNDSIFAEYMATKDIPSDPVNKLTTGSCSQAGQYLYVSTPDPNNTFSQPSYILMATLDNKSDPSISSTGQYDPFESDAATGEYQYYYDQNNSTTGTNIVKSSPYNLNPNYFVIGGSTRDLAQAYVSGTSYGAGSYVLSCSNGNCSVYKNDTSGPLTDDPTTSTDWTLITVGNQGNGGGGLVGESSGLVLVHNIPEAGPICQQPSMPYGSDFPLNYGLCQKGGNPTRAYLDVETAKKAGIDGFEIDNFTQPDASVMDPYLKAASQIGGFVIAPVVDTSILHNQGIDDATMVSKVTTSLQAYINDVKSNSYPAAYRVDPSNGQVNTTGSYVIVTYGTNQYAESDWAQVKANLAAQGISTYWVINAGENNTTDAQFEQTASMYIPMMNAVYSFKAPDDSYFSWLSDLTSSTGQHIPYFGGGWFARVRGAGFAVSQPPDGTDAQGTLYYRQMWDRELASGNFPNINLSTWNDYTEHTNLDPDADFESLRADMTAWYSAIYKNISETQFFSSPELYVTVPQALYQSQTSVAEATLLDPSSSSIPITLKLEDLAGNIVSSSQTITVDHGIEVVTLPVPYSAKILQAVATAGGNVNQAITSAPILYYPNNPPKGPKSGVPMQYYSSMAQPSLTKPTLSISNGTVNVTLPAGSPTPRFVEILHDQDLAQYLSPSTSTSAPLTTTVSIDPTASGLATTSNDNFGDSTDYHWYVARLVYQSNNTNIVTYSDPVSY